MDMVMMVLNGCTGLLAECILQTSLIVKDLMDKTLV
jgi:hypothetical protein